MCGIAGFATSVPLDLRGTLRAMTDAIRHRGPDDSGEWIDANSGIALGQRRLAIIDLSAEGHQPKASASGRFVITFNGEIYNFQELRSLLQQRGHTFRGASDTEVILAACEEWGVAAALPHLVGMFAFAVWDVREQTLTLARDRFGEKPLYYGWLGNQFGFASELKALAHLPTFAPEISRSVTASYLRYGYIAGPHSVYEGIWKLVPGSYLTLDLPSLHQRPAAFDPGPGPSVRRYWSLKEVVERGQSSPFRGSDDEAANELEGLLRQSVGGQMIADVPLGAFLSGGIDSSLIVALMQAQSSRPVKTFSIGFHDKQFNEAESAKRVAQHLGTDHTEQYLSGADALAVIPSLADMYDEPFADSSQIPTHLVAALARTQVTVSLSGDAGDELFAGYDRYLRVDRLWRWAAKLPHTARQLVARGVLRTPPRALNFLLAPLHLVLPATPSWANLGDKAHRAARVLASRTPSEMYRHVMTQWIDPGALVIGGTEAETVMDRASEWPDRLGALEHMMFVDAMHYLPDDILVKVDRAAMAVALESRVPFLDPRVVEFVWRLPSRLRLRGEVTKWLLRNILYRHVPKELLERPKMGFGVPLASWLRGELREWAEDLLSEASLKRSGILSAAAVRSCWQEHISGVRNWEHRLWSVLMFEAWVRRQRERWVPSQLRRAA